MAVSYAPNCTLLVNNTGGSVQSLPDVRVGGKLRVFTEVITLASQASASSIMFARIPYGSELYAIQVSVSATLSTSTLSFGDANSATRYGAAVTFTVANTKVDALNVVGRGVPLTTCYDNTGTVSSSYTDLLATIGTANLPASGTLVIVTEYVDYGA